MDTTTAIQFSDIQPVLEALTTQITVSNVIAIVAAVVGACVGFVFMWWGVGQVKGKLMKAFKRGKI